jgi:hypothetical protein
MDLPVLSDRRQFPTDRVIFAHLGKSKVLWRSLFDALHSEHPELTEEWRYYNDGKSWLLKVSRKAKTIFWIKILENSFRATAYFTDRAKEAIMSSSLSESLKAQYLDPGKTGKLRGITITFRSGRDVRHARTLADLKIAVK